MSLLGTLESVIFTVTPDESLRGIRIRKKRKLIELCAWGTSANDGRPFTERFQELRRTLGWHADMQLFFAPALKGGVFFQTELPKMPEKEIPAALEFIVPQQLLSLPESWRMQFITLPAQEEAEKIRIAAWVCGAAELQKLYNHLAAVPCKPDDIVEPMLALPFGALSPEAVFHFPEFQPGFYWQKGSFHAVAETPPAEANGELKAYLKERYLWKDAAKADELLESYLPSLTIGNFIESPRFDAVRAGLDLVPPEFRPQRLRTQLRIGAVLLAALLLLAGWNFVRSARRYADEYRSVNNTSQRSKKRMAELQKKLKARDKAFKEMSRILDQSGQSEQLMAALGQLSQSLPQQVLVSRFRAAENSLEITMQSSQEDLNLEPALRKMAGYKISNLQNRKMSDTLTLYNLRMEPVAKGERKKRK